MKLLKVYVDTTKKSLVVQGASGPRFFPFVQMREVDLQTHTAGISYVKCPD